MGHDKLTNVYKTNFALRHHYHWNLSELESMMPWERYVYIDLLDQYMKEQEELRQLHEREQKARMATIERQQKSKMRR